MANEEIMNRIENTLDEVEDTIATIERIPRMNLNGTTRKQQVIIISTVAVVSSAATVVVSRLVKKVRARKQQSVVHLAN